ncbi:unnamed protein product [Angiostrongylus costaricensis]|uniref:Transmembrane protein n=1 Tax=Angiostrongylus costaricensis TaxID=334426 RepID=A0A0R3Q1C3_ANGCS|nr:unnamed protein product [Angiostrongylus costaricensis]
MSIDSSEQLTTGIRRLRLKRPGLIWASVIFVAYALTPNCDEEEVEAFNKELEQQECHIGTHGLDWKEQGERLTEFIITTKTIHGNSQFQKPHPQRWTWESPNDDHLLRIGFYFSQKEQKSKVTKKRLSPDAPKLIRQRGIAGGTGDRELTSEHAKQCEQATNEDLKKRKGAAMVETAAAEQSIRKVLRSFAS